MNKLFLSILIIVIIIVLTLYFYPPCNFHPIGSSYLASDDCNTCHCDFTGVVCTSMGCIIPEESARETCYLNIYRGCIESDQGIPSDWFDPIPALESGESCADLIEINTCDEYRLSLIS